jgi:hypothetical protein
VTVAKSTATKGRKGTGIRPLAKPCLKPPGKKSTKKTDPKK